MKERPILFSAEMVRAILDRGKTQTRRILKHQPSPCNPNGEWNHLHIPAADWKNETVEFYDTGDGQWACKYCGNGVWYNGKDVGAIKCPFGQPGDRLYVRETWRGSDDTLESVFYKADIKLSDPAYMLLDKWKPSIHMPKKYARIWLEITEVRVERIRDISEEDSISEGIVEQSRPGFRMRGFGLKEWNESDCCYDAKCAFRNLWQSTYPGSWERNDWVWVLIFRRVQQ